MLLMFELLFFTFALRGFNIHTLMCVHEKHKQKGRQQSEIGKGIMTKIWLQLWLNRNRTLFRFRFCLYTWSSVWLLFAQQCISTQQSAYFCACFPHLFYFLYHFSISLYFVWALTCAHTLIFSFFFLLISLVLRFSSAL